MFRRFCPVCGKKLTSKNRERSSDLTFRCKRCRKEVADKNAPSSNHATMIGPFKAIRANWAWKHVCELSLLDKITTMAAQIKPCPICGTSACISIRSTNKTHLFECPSTTCPVAPSSEGYTFLEAKRNWNTQRWSNTKVWN